MTSTIDCAICHDSFNDPRLLSCTHTFCRDCLKTYVDKNVRLDRPDVFRCPVCRSDVKLPEDGVNGIQKNFYLTESDTQISKTKYQPCREHPEEDLRFYCLKCDIIICRDCKVVSHEGHQTGMLKDVITNLKQKIENILDVAEEDIKESEKQLRRDIESEMLNLEESLSVPKRIVEAMKEELEDIVQEITEQAKPHIECRKESLAKITEWAECRHQRLRECRNVLSQGLNFKEDSMVTIAVLKQLVDNEAEIKQITKPPSPPLAKSSGHFDEKRLEAEFLRFSESVKRASEEFKKRLNMDYYCEPDTKLRDSTKHTSDESLDEELQQSDTEATPDSWEERLSTKLEMKTPVKEKLVRPKSWAAVAGKKPVVKSKAYKTPTTSSKTDLQSLGKTPRSVIYKREINVKSSPERDRSLVSQLQGNLSIGEDAIEQQAQHNETLIGATGTPERSEFYYPNAQQLFIGNLPSNALEGEIGKCFEKYGNVVEVRLSKKSGPYSNYGFVVFDHAKPVEQILKEKPEIFLRQRRLNIRKFKPRRSEDRCPDSPPANRSPPREESSSGGWFSNWKSPFRFS